MISSGDFLDVLFWGLELATIPLAALVAYNLFKARSSEAGVKLILTAAVSSGSGLIWNQLALWSTWIPMYFDQVADRRWAIAIWKPWVPSFFFSGLAFKISIVPFHFWTADVYEGAPTNVTAYLSVISKGAATLHFGHSAIQSLCKCGRALAGSHMDHSRPYHDDRESLCHTPEPTSNAFWHFPLSLKPAFCSWG